MYSIFSGSLVMLAGGCRVDGDVRGGLVGGGVEGRPRVAGAGSRVGVGVRGAADHLGSTKIIENAYSASLIESRVQ